MANFANKDIMKLFIGQDAAKSTGGIPTLNDGEIGLFTPAGTRLTEASAATVDRFIIVKKTPNAGIILVSGPINKTDVTATRGLFIASADQVSYIGYDGTTGLIDVFNENKYHVRVSIRQGRTSNHGGLYLKHGFYTSDASATQFEIAHNILKALSVEFSKEPDKIVRSEMLSDDAGAALGGAATLSVVNGSKYIVASSAAHALVPGDAVRIGGTTTTTPVYVVDTVNGAEIKLTSIYQGTTATGVAGEELTALTGNFGIRMTGLPQPFRTGKLEQDGQPLIFDITLDGFGETTYRFTAATAGSGNERQIKSLEFFAQGNEGNTIRTPEPYVFPLRAEASGNYDMIELQVQEVYKDSIVAGPINKQFTLAIPQTTPAYADGGTADDITDVLEVLIYGAVNGSLAL